MAHIRSSASAVIVTPGASGTSTITATGAGGYTGTVTLSSCVLATSPASATLVPTCTIGTSPITISSGQNGCNRISGHSHNRGEQLSQADAQGDRKPLRPVGQCRQFRTCWPSARWHPGSQTQIQIDTWADGVDGSAGCTVWMRRWRRQRRYVGSNQSG